MRCSLLSRVCVAILLFAAPPASAACVDYATAVNPQPVSTIPVYPGLGEEGGWHSVGHLLFTATDSLLTIHDLSDPANPTLEGAFGFPSGSDLTDVFVDGDYAYVTMETGTSPNLDSFLAVVDISDPQNPSLAGTSAGTGGYSLDEVVVAQGNAWVTAFYTILVFNVANPSYPGPGYEGGPYVQYTGLGTDGEYVYATGNIFNASPQARMFVYDPAPANPWYGFSPEAQFSDFGPCFALSNDPMTYQLALGEGVAFVSGGIDPVLGIESVITVVDVSDPASPSRYDCIDMPGIDPLIYSMIAKGRYLYATIYASSNYSILVYDIGDLSDITLTGQFDISEESFGIEVTQDALVVGTDPAQVFGRQCDAPVILDSTISTGIHPLANDTVDWSFSWQTEYWSDPALDKVVIVNTANPFGDCAFVPGTTIPGSLVNGTCVKTATGWLHSIRFNAGECVPGCAYTYTVSSTRTGLETVSAPKPKRIKKCAGIIYKAQQSSGFVLQMEATPNPFNPATTIRFNVPGAAANAKLSIYDTRGHELDVIYSGRAEQGWKEFIWNGRDAAGAQLPSGVYFAKLVVDGESLVQKLVMLK